MQKLTFCKEKPIKYLKKIIGTSLLFSFLTLGSLAQNVPSVDGEMATCKITLNGKISSPQLNQMGSFERVQNIKPLSLVSMQVTYPNGKAGEKIVLTAEDGGTFNNGNTVEVVQLDANHQCSFTFKVPTGEGLCRVMLHRGDDFKTIKLWVGDSPVFVQN